MIMINLEILEFTDKMQIYSGLVFNQNSDKKYVNHSKIFVTNNHVNMCHFTP